MFFKLFSEILVTCEYFLYPLNNDIREEAHVEKYSQYRVAKAWLDKTENWNFKRRGYGPSVLNNRELAMLQIKANWPGTRHLFSNFTEAEIRCSRRAVFIGTGGKIVRKQRENRVFGPVERKENWSTNKRMVSTNEPAELTRIEPGGKKFHDAFNSGRVSNFCSISPSDFSRTRAKTCLCIRYTVCISNYTHFQLCISIKNNCKLRSNAKKKK